MRVRFTWFPVLMLPLLAGCGIGDIPPVAPANAPLDWRSGSAADPIWPDQGWWRGFQSPELDQLIAQAQTNNQNIAAAIGRIRQADAQLRIAGAPLLPLLQADANGSWQQVQRGTQSGIRSNSGQPYADVRSYSAGLSASYEFDVWGRVQAQRQSALDTARFSRFDRETVALTVVTSTANTWFSALGYQDRLNVATNNLRDAEQTLAVIRARLSVGTANALDVSQQETLVAQERANLPGLHNQLEQAINGLGILTGQPPAAIKLRPTSLLGLSLPAVSPGLPVDVLARRPDVAAAEAQLAAAGANVVAARSAMFPAIKLSLSGSYQSAALTTLFGPGAMLASLVGGVTQPIFDGGTLRGQLEQTRGRQDELLADYRQAVLQAFTDVENALVAWRFTTEQEALQAQAVASAERSATIARAQLAAGTIDIVTSLISETNLYNAQDALAQIRLTRFQALVALYKALGGGWQGAIEPPMLKPGLLKGGIALPIGSNLR